MQSNKDQPSIGLSKQAMTYRCGISGCSVTYQHSGSLSKHIRKKHQTSKLNMKNVNSGFYCDICEKFFLNKKTLMQHHPCSTSDIQKTEEHQNKEVKQASLSNALPPQQPIETQPTVTNIIAHNSVENQLAFESGVDLVDICLLGSSCSNAPTMPSIPKQERYSTPQRNKAKPMKKQNKHSNQKSNPDPEIQIDVYTISKTMNSVGIQFNSEMLGVQSVPNVNELSDSKINPKDTITEVGNSVVQTPITEPDIWKSIWKRQQWLREEREEYLKAQEEIKETQSQLNFVTPQNKGKKLGVNRVTDNKMQPLVLPDLTEKDSNKLAGYFDQYLVAVQDFVNQNQNKQSQNQTSATKGRPLKRSAKKDLFKAEKVEPWVPLPLQYLGKDSCAELIHFLRQHDFNDQSLLCELGSYFSMATFYCNLVQQTSTFTYIQSKPVHKFLNAQVNQFLTNAYTSRMLTAQDVINNIDLIYQDGDLLEIRNSTSKSATHLCCFDIHIDKIETKKLIEAINNTPKLQYVLWPLNSKQCLGDNKLKHFCLLGELQVDVLGQENQVTFYLYKRTQAQVSQKSDSKSPESEPTTIKKILGKRGAAQSPSQKNFHINLNDSSTKVIATLTTNSKKRLKKATQYYSSALALQILKREKETENRKLQIRKQIQAVNPMSQYEQSLYLAKKLFHFYTGPKKTMMESQLQELVLVNEKKKGVFIAKASLTEGLQKLEAAMPNWIKYVPNKQGGYIKMNQEFTFTQIQDTLKQYYKVDDSQLATVFAIEKNAMFMKPVDKLRAHWNIAKFESDQLEQIYRKMQQIMNLPKLKESGEIRASKNDMEEVEKAFANDPIFLGLSQRGKHEFLEGAKFYTHYSNLNQYMTRDILNRLDLLFECYKNQENMEAKVSGLNSEIESMIKNDAARIGLNFQDKIGESLTIRTFRVLQQEMDQSIIPGHSHGNNLVVRIYWSPLTSKQQDCINAYSSKAISDKHFGIQVIKNLDLLGKPAQLVPWYPFNMTSFVRTERILLKHVSIIVHALVKTLNYAHLNQIYHLNLKPTNVLFTNEYKPYLTDWHVSDAFDQGLINEYTPPEIITGKYRQGQAFDMRARDSWGFGLILYYMLFHSLPYKTSELLKLKDQEPLPADRLEIDGREYGKWAHSIKWLLHPNPAERITINSILDCDNISMQFKDIDLKSADFEEYGYQK